MTQPHTVPQTDLEKITALELHQMVETQLATGQVLTILAVPGGWMYTVSLYRDVYGISSSVFIPNTQFKAH